MENGSSEDEPEPTSPSRFPLKANKVNIIQFTIACTYNVHVQYTVCTLYMYTVHVHVHCMYVVHVHCTCTVHTCTLYTLHILYMYMYMYNLHVYTVVLRGLNFVVFMSL